MIEMVKAGPEDAVIVGKIRGIVYNETYRSIYPDEMLDHYNLESYAQWDRQRIMDPKQHYHLFMYSVNCVGDYSYGPTHYEPHKDFELYISSLYIRKEYTGLGLGRKAVDQVRKHCAEQGFTKFCCGCNAHNLPPSLFAAIWAASRETNRFFMNRNTMTSFILNFT